jgi:hypothetical protein
MQRIAMAVLSLVAFSSLFPVAAQNKTSARKACASDYQKFCADIAVGGGRVKKCLNEHLQQLTSDCRAAVATFNAKDAEKK